MESEYAFDDTPEGEPTWLQRRPVGDDLPTDAWPGRGALDGKDRGKYKVLRRVFLQQAQARRDVCYFCQGAINYAEPYGSPWAAEIHHTVAVAAMEMTGEGNPLDTRLWAASHSICNKSGMAVGADPAAEDEPDAHAGLVQNADGSWPSEAW